MRTLDDRARVVLALPTAAATATLPEQWAIGIAACALATVVAASDVRVSDLLRKVLPAMPFLLIVGALVPFAGHGDRVFTIWPGLGITEDGFRRWMLIMSRGVLAIGWLAMLAALTPPERMFAALAHMRVPGAAVSIGWLVYRYLWVLGDEGRRMVRAWQARRRGGWRAGDVRVLGGIAALMFIRSIERAERIDRAMRARGFEGTLVHRPPQPWSRRDSAACAVGIAAIIAFSSVAHVWSVT